MCVFASAGVAAMLWRSLLLVACLAVVAQAKVRTDAHLPSHLPKGEPQLGGDYHHAFVQSLYVCFTLRVT